MATPSTKQPTPAKPAVRRATITGGAVAAVGSAVVAVVVGAIGKAAGAPHVKELSAGPLATLAIVGVIIATATWTWVGNRHNGRRLLTQLVPLVLVLSFVPDIALGLGDTAWSAVITLMVAHVAVFAVTIPTLTRLTLPRTERPTTPEPASRHVKRRTTT